MSAQIEMAEADIGRGVSGVAIMVEMIDELLTKDSVGPASLQALLALAQKSGALLERGLNQLGHGPGILGNAEEWLRR